MGPPNLLSNDQVGRGHGQADRKAQGENFLGIHGRLPQAGEMAVRRVAASRPAVDRNKIQSCNSPLNHGFHVVAERRIIGSNISSAQPTVKVCQKRLKIGKILKVSIISKVDASFHHAMCVVVTVGE